MADTFSVRLPKEQTRFLDKMAKATDRSRNKLISSAVGRMMENYEFVMRKIEQGERDFAEGRVVDHDDVARRTDALLDRLDRGE